MSLFSSSAAFALQCTNPRPNNKFFGSVDYRYYTVVCGGHPHSRSENNAHNIILNKFAVNYRERYPTILLTSNLSVAEQIYNRYGNRVVLYGLNKAYDPFGSTDNADEANYILTQAANAFLLRLSVAF